MDNIEEFEFGCNGTLRVTTIDGVMIEKGYKNRDSAQKALDALVAEYDR